MTSDLLSEILNTFKTHGHAPDLRAEVMALPGEVWINILAPQPTEAMHELARLIESEFDELGQRVSIGVQRPASGLWGWLARSGRPLLGFR
ncbi:MAG: hypothetical protein F9K25_18645 [Candidatus Contendobacter sp.]|nr:MAG: hypothetical protein F9K25_18645 [Candidatus Contendobacter sp.]